MSTLRSVLLLLAAIFVLPSEPGGAMLYVEPPTLRLPTNNNAVLQGRSGEFYQHTLRRVRGSWTRPWQAGQYGFVRNPIKRNGRMIYTRFHEGVDIRPLQRSRSGEPLDTVRAISSGEVVHVNDHAGRSSYGRYVVVRHFWNGSPFFSLYAHLAEPMVKVGEMVDQGAKLARMGHTGPGVPRRRAHVHFEVGMLLNEHFQPWYDKHFRGEPNYHGLYNGLNMAGIDIMSFYLTRQINPTLQLSEWLRHQAPSFTVVVPSRSAPNLVRRYPWLMEEPQLPAPYTSWEIGFTRGGIPISLRPAEDAVSEPQLKNVRSDLRDIDCFTGGLLYARGDECRITRVGERYLELLVWPSGRERHRWGE